MDGGTGWRAPSFLSSSGPTRRTLHIYIQLAASTRGPRLGRLRASRGRCKDSSLIRRREPQTGCSFLMPPALKCLSGARLQTHLSPWVSQDPLFAKNSGGRRWPRTFACLWLPAQFVQEDHPTSLQLVCCAPCPSLTIPGPISPWISSPKLICLRLAFSLPLFLFSPKEYFGAKKSKFNHPKMRCRFISHKRKDCYIFVIML